MLSVIIYILFWYLHLWLVSHMCDFGCTYVMCTPFLCVCTVSYLHLSICVDVWVFFSVIWQVNGFIVYQNILSLWNVWSVLCMYLFIFVSMYYVCMCTCICVYMYVCTLLYIIMYMCMYAYVCMYAYEYLYMCMCVCMNVCTPM